MGDFKALRASRKLSLMRADRFKRTRLFCFFLGQCQKEKQLKKAKIGLLTFSAVPDY
jgi:hypothetical protein